MMDLKWRQLLEFMIRGAKILQSDAAEYTLKAENCFQSIFP
jgi:hypothetical protein